MFCTFNYWRLWFNILCVCHYLCFSLFFFRLIGMAVKHYHKQLLHRCVGGWMVEVGRERGRREREEEERKHRERVQAFLEAATLSVTAKEKEQEGDKDLPPQPSPLPSPPRRTEETVRGVHRRISRKTPPPVMWQAARKHVVSMYRVMQLSCDPFVQSSPRF